MKPERDPGDQAQAQRKSAHREPQGAKRTMCKTPAVSDGDQRLATGERKRTGK